MDIRAKAYGISGHPSFNNPFHTIKCPAADKQDIGGINVNHFLIRMLSSPLRWNIGYGSFQNLKQCLLYPFTGYIAGNGWIFRLSGNLVYFINVDNTALCLFNIVICRLNKTKKDILHIFPYIAGFRKACGIGNGKGNIEKTCQGLRKQCLAAACRSQHDDVGLLNFHIIVTEL